jgi:YVTN family beta-propeller protein
VTLGIASNPGGGSLSGTVSVEAVNGVASFPGLSIDQPGSGYSLVALSAGLTPATSADFDVVLTGPFAYVSTGSNAISVIDLSTNSVVAEIPAAANLQRLSVSPDGETVYALSSSGGTSAIVVVDATTNQVETSVSPSASCCPNDIALMPDGSVLYVSRSGFPGRILLFDTATNSMLPTEIFVADLPSKLAISPFGTHLYVVHQTGAIAVIDTATNSVVATAPSAGIDGIRAFALSPDGTKGYVTHHIPSPGIYVFNTATNTAITNIPVGGGPYGVAFTPDGLRAYVANVSGYVSLIDTATDTVMETIPVGGTFAAMSPVGDQVYVTNGGSNSVTVIDTGTNTVVDSVNLDGLPGDIAFRPFEISTFAVTSVDDGGPGSLRQAFADANANPGPDYIEFNIPGPGPHTISPLSPLPALTSPVRLDATTEPDYAGTPVVEIEGSSAGAGAVGIELRSGSSLVYGFAVNRFGGAGIILSGGGNSNIHGNYVGTDVTGSLDRGNGAQGLLIENSRNNDVLGTLIGTPTNVFSGNGGAGVEIAGSRATGNRVRANRIGTDLGGTSPIGNDGGGVRVSAPGNTIGGPSVFDRNIISGNDGDGILLDVGSDNSTVHAQLIGVDFFGTSPLGNAGWGIRILSDGNSIGGFGSFNRNVISGNGLGGLRVEGSNNAIHDNAIGTDAAGSLPLGNSGPGVEIAGGSDNRFATVGNHIAHNSGDGVVILAGERNSLALNLIHSNGGLGIDLGGDGVTANDAGGDPDGGPNTLLNFPVITSATTGAVLTVDATFHSTPSTQFNIRFYRSSVCDPSGNGEGETPMGAINLLTGATGDAFINGMTFSPVPAGEFITALASDTLGNTSEFSSCAPVTFNAPGVITFDAAGGGGNVTYDGEGGAANGNGIVIASIAGTGTPQNDGTALPCVACVLTFDTGANLTEGVTYTWGGGGTFTLTGSIPSLGFGPGVILTGTFTSASAVTAGPSGAFDAIGTDTKETTLVEFFYGTLGFTPTFEFQLDVSGSVTVQPNLGFDMAPDNADIQNSIP